MNSKTQAVVLAGGESSRFYPLNKFGHKSLLSLMGKSLIERCIDSIIKSGIKKIIVVEDLRKPISKALSGKYKNIELKFISQERPLGMGDALLSSEKLLESEFFVSSAYHSEFNVFADDIRNAKKKESDIVILTKEDKDPRDFGVIKKVNGKITVDEKSKNSDAWERIVGIYLLNKKFVEVLKKIKKSHYDFEDAIGVYSESNEITIVKTNKKTLSLKYPWDILEVKDYLFEQAKSAISDSAQISNKAILKGEKIIIETDVKIMDGAVINGPCYIGKNAYVGTNSILRSGTVLEKNVRIGAQMEVKNSVLMSAATTHSGFIGDSVVGEKTKIAAAFNTGNVRLDRGEIFSTVKGEKINTHRKYFGTIIGSGTSFGIGVGTMPGVIIGNNCIIGPGTTVMENIPDNVTYYAEFKKTIQRKHESKK